MRCQLAQKLDVRRDKYDIRGYYVGIGARMTVRLGRDSTLE